MITLTRQELSDKLQILRSKRVAVGEFKVGVSYWATNVETTLYDEIKINHSPVEFQITNIKEVGGDLKIKMITGKKCSSVPTHTWSGMVFADQEVAIEYYNTLCAFWVLFFEEKINKLKATQNTLIPS